MHAFPFINGLFIKSIYLFGKLTVQCNKNKFFKFYKTDQVNTFKKNITID